MVLWLGILFSDCFKAFRTIKICCTGETEQYIDLEMLSELKNSGDLVIRFQTDIQSGDSLFTDLNGHTIQHHKFKAKLKTQVTPDLIRLLIYQI